MNTNRTTARIVGVLFIIATTFFMIGQFIYDPIFSAPDYLKNTYPNKCKVIAGILIELIGDFSIILIPVFLFPMLKRQNEALALGYAGFRFLEAGFLIIPIVGTLSQLTLSQHFLGSNLADTRQYEILWSGIQAIKDWAFMMSVSFLFPAGTLIVYYLLYKTNLIPRFLSVWGFFAGLLLLTGSILTLFDTFEGISMMVVELVLTLPIAIQEIVMAIWLIAKGFKEINYEAT